MHNSIYMADEVTNRLANLAKHIAVETNLKPIE